MKQEIGINERKIVNIQTGEISYQEESDEQKDMYAE